MNLGFHHQSTFAENFLSYIEKKGGGVLNFGEFIRIATAKINEEYTQPQTSLVFSAYDPKATGKFSIYDLKDTIRGIG
jgi:Ca2+-binding EF-hand superfamily protein